MSEDFNDTQKTTQETTLENHHVRYSLKKLEKQDLLEIEKPDGMIERKINGQKRVFQAPLKARLTEKGLQTLNEFGQASKKYEGVTYNQLVQKVHRSESDIDRLQESLETFRK